MSENSEAPGTPSATPSGETPGPQPESLRFFGTTWVDHDGGYGLRRAGATIGSLAAAVAACFILRFAYQGLEIAEVGSLVGMLVVLMFAICSAIAFRKTWEGFTRRPADPSQDDRLRGLKSIGFIGSLLAYFFRSFQEAPGEKLRRTEYETALAQYAKRRSSRTGNPAARRSAKGKRSGRR
uniref:EamA/RhaT family transporter n=1 Tax=Streptomyces sp. NBC_01401 TaxID=2903854 RepID=A0AAU3GV26_9ACTN